MALADFRVLTFDVVGTLIDFESGVVAHVQKTASLVGRELNEEVILDAYRNTRDSENKGRYPDDLVRGYREMEATLGLPHVPGAAEGLRDSVKEWPAFPDSVEALQRLKRHFRLVAMTNARNWALNYMSKTLGNPFDDTITVDDTQCEKPNKRFFEFAMSRLNDEGFTQKDNLHVAQSQYHDIGVARSLGYTVCWIERRMGKKGFGGTQEPDVITRADYHFSSLSELADAVDAGA